MIRPEIRERFPLTLWTVRLSIYDGKINCLVREKIAHAKGASFVTPDNEVIPQAALMRVVANPEDPEFERQTVCDDESRVDECVQILTESLRAATAKKILELQAMDAIARQGEVLMKRRNFVD